MSISLDIDSMSPRQIVAELDKYIVGQDKAKKSVAIALRNRVRRKRLPAELQDEVAPKNIIMIGPTGVGKTEIARRISKLSGAPFIKVEATKFTEVGYVGRDVESMVRDLMHVAVNMVRQELQEEVREQAQNRAEESLLDLLLPGSKTEQANPKAAGTGMPGLVSGSAGPSGPGFLGIDLGQLQAAIMGQKTASSSETNQSGDAKPAEELKPDPVQLEADAKARERMRAKLRQGVLDDREVEIQVSSQNPASIEVFSGSGIEGFDFNLGNLQGLLGGNKKKRKRLKVGAARDVLIAEEMAKLVDSDQAGEIARERAQQMGIIFIDEIDKIASRGNKGGGPDVSREGVQRDILPIVEGCQVNTKYGLVDTRHILFIAAGAFHMSKPSDLIPELQGRFPIRVELESLGEADFFRILTQPANAITVQYQELLKTEGVELVFEEPALRLLASIAAEVNQKTENIGARRLSTIMELLLEEVSFHASEMQGQKVTVSEAYVRERLDTVVKDQDLSRYIL